MTKPITSTALMMLYEHSLFHLTDPVSKFIPEFKKVKVFVNEGELADLSREITIQDLLRHTAGLSYGGSEEPLTPVDKLYDQADLFNTDITLQEMVRRMTDLPLVYQPGQAWRYSVATDVVGRLVELISDMPLADFFAEKIFGPLDMGDTAFWAPSEKAHRLATLYGLTPNNAFDVLEKPATSKFLAPVHLFSGGAGLVSTAADYLRFAQCILNKGALEDARLLGRKTVSLMTANHLPHTLLPLHYNGLVDKRVFGIGFGLGFSVFLGVSTAGVMGSMGDHGWGGYAETYFWVDPQEEVIGILMGQCVPSLTYPIRRDFRTLVYQALIA